MRTRVLQKWASDWRALRAWGCDLSDVDIDISETKHPRRRGTCWPLERRLTLYRGDSITEDLSFLLHEMAHVVTIHDNHGSEWQSCFARAVTEVTRIPIPEAYDNFMLLDQAAQAAIGSWWQSSGNAFAYSLLRNHEE